MLQLPITNTLETSEKIERSSKEIEVIEKKQIEMFRNEKKNTVTEILKKLNGGT